MNEGSARAEILERLDEANRGRLKRAASASAGTRLARPGDTDLLTQRLIDHGASVAAVPSESAIAGVAAEILRYRGVATVALAADLPSSWRPAGVGTVEDDPPIPIGVLASQPACLTHSAFAIAETGTIVLDGGPGQGRRALTLLPDLHLCVVDASSIVADVVDAFVRLDGSPAPITMISGPSATSDIELKRAVGVHGPRTLEVILVR